MKYIRYESDITNRLPSTIVLPFYINNEITEQISQGKIEGVLDIDSKGVLSTTLIGPKEDIFLEMKTTSFLKNNKVVKKKTCSPDSMCGNGMVAIFTEVGKSYGVDRVEEVISDLLVEAIPEFQSRRRRKIIEFIKLREFESANIPYERKERLFKISTLSELVEWFLEDLIPSSRISERFQIELQRFNEEEMYEILYGALQNLKKAVYSPKWVVESGTVFLPEDTIIYVKSSDEGGSFLDKRGVFMRESGKTNRFLNRIEGLFEYTLLDSEQFRALTGRVI